MSDKAERKCGHQIKYTCLLHG